MREHLKSNLLVSMKTILKLAFQSMFCLFIWIKSPKIPSISHSYPINPILHKVQDAKYHIKNLLDIHTPPLTISNYLVITLRLGK